MAVEQIEVALVPRNVILQGHVLAQLATLPDESVQCVVTSPPYYGLRTYATEPQIWGGHPDCTHVWGPTQRTPWANELPGPNGRRKNTLASRECAKESGPFCVVCNAWRGELGQELVPDCDRAGRSDACGACYVCHVVEVFREVRRVLRRDGTCFVNLGDTYANNPSTSAMSRAEQGNGTGVFSVPGEQHVRARRQTANRLTPMRQMGAKHKDLMLLPHRIALALQRDGWWVRMDNVWSKENCMPESVTDRTTRSHEYVFHLTKSEAYYFDAEAIKEDVTGNAHSRGAGVHPKSAAPGDGIKANRSFEASLRELVGSRNCRSVWTINPKPFPAAHFAVMPEELAARCILAGTSPKACEHCGAPFERVVEKRRARDTRAGRNAMRGAGHMRTQPGGPANRAGREFQVVTRVETVGWRPTCRCAASTGTGRCIVLDPFIGAGTVAVVAQRHERDWLGCELQPKYVAIAERRIRSAGAKHVVLDVPEDAPEQFALFEA